MTSTTQHLALVPGLNSAWAVFDGVVAPARRHRAPRLDNPPLERWRPLPRPGWPVARALLAGGLFLRRLRGPGHAGARPSARGIALPAPPLCRQRSGGAKGLAALDAVAQGRYFEMVSAQAGNAPPRQPQQQRPDGRAPAWCGLRPEPTPPTRATAARPDRNHLLNGDRPTRCWPPARPGVRPETLEATPATPAPTSRPWRTPPGPRSNPPPWPLRCRPGLGSA